jgi:hypothetical protein
VTGYSLDVRVSIPDSSEISLFSTASRLALGLIQWLPGIKQLQHEADHLHLVLRSRMVEVYLRFPLIPWRA